MYVTWPMITSSVRLTGSRYVEQPQMRFGSLVPPPLPELIRPPRQTANGELNTRKRACFPQPQTLVGQHFMLSPDQEDDYILYRVVSCTIAITGLSFGVQYDGVMSASYFLSNVTDSDYMSCGPIMELVQTNWIGIGTGSTDQFIVYRGTGTVTPRPHPTGP